MNVAQQYVWDKWILIVNILKTNGILEVLLRNSGGGVNLNLSLRICTAVAKTKHGHCLGEPKNRPNKSRDWRS